MKFKPVRFLLYFLLVFSFLALACSAFTPKADPFAVTQTAVANLIASSAANGQSIEQTAIAAVTAAGSNDIVLTTIAYATQVATSGAYNVTPPGFVGSAIPPGFGSAPENIPIMAGATDVQVIPGVILYTSPASVPDTKQYYLDEMPKHEWVYDLSLTFENSFSVTLHFHNAAGQNIQIMINSATGQVKVNMTYTR
ncbi:MAG: hypothetical protein HY867_05165 [Chloroflexi bacterium]|nr:hypothetical protein [Chloroflexota bacterium]